MNPKRFNQELFIKGYSFFQKGGVKFISSSANNLNFQASDNRSNSFHIVLKILNTNLVKGHCECQDFSESLICYHIPACFLELQKQRLVPSLNVNSLFIPVLNKDNLFEHNLISLMRGIAEEENNQKTIFPPEQKPPFDEIRYEFYLPHQSGRDYTIINFHTASLLKSGQLGKFKAKKIKTQDLPNIKSEVDLKILKSISPFLSNSNYYDQNSKHFDCAEIPSQMSHLLIEIIQSGRAFIQNRPGGEDSSLFRYIEFIQDAPIEIKISTDCKKRTASLVYFYKGEEITDFRDLFLFTASKLIYLQGKFYRLSNYLNKNILQYFIREKVAHFEERQFSQFRDEILTLLDHRAFTGDHFLLPKKEIQAPYVAHLKLPITGELIQAKLVQEKDKLSPPFDFLTLYQDGQSTIYEDFISHELQCNIDEMGFFQIPLDKFHYFIKKSSELGLKIIADKAVIKPSSDFNLSMTHDLNWFEVKGSARINGEEITLPEILKKIKGNDPFIELKSGEISYIPKAWLEKVLRLNEIGEYIDGKYVIHQSRAMQLEALEVQCLDLSLFLDKLKNFKSLPDVTVAPKFKGELRSYQTFGLKWMKFLRDLGLGGCLADDMGLGKTVQVAANLQIRKKEKSFSKLPTLIVCPKSLIFNWKNELEKFTPDLKVEVFETSKQDLSQSKTNIILTTYGIIQRNAEKFSQLEFDYIILDEAQAIKNPRSLTAKATYTLKSHHRLALTGTPIENHIGELYSIFNFLMPGVYKKAALNPDHSNRAKAQGLRPFILRRTKSQVLVDLPDRVEQIIMCEQAPDEKKHYQKLKDFVAASINKEVDLDNFKKSSFMVLEALTRLRQASCHPGLVNADLNYLESGKLNQLKEMLTEILEEGHKVIVFSQFTTLLKLAREKTGLDETNSVYLDGSTTKREEVVSEFQKSKTKNVFFLSLKAGGTGLNLTEASYCFILDPWWNPAVEEQAIGRLHRMGQKKSVNVYRLITQDSIEEKVLELQKLKHAVIKDIVSDENEGFIRSLGPKDLNFLLQ